MRGEKSSIASDEFLGCCVRFGVCFEKMGNVFI